MAGILQCACSATFPTSDDLNAHLDEQKSLRDALEKSKANLSAALERCSAHSTVRPGNTQDGEEESRKGRHCPYTGCGRTKAFCKRKELRIHFRAHVECNEVCQCCAIRFKGANQLLRHTPNVSKMDAHQKIYMTERRGVVSKRVDDELLLAENEKRAQDAADESAGTYKRVKLTLDPVTTGFQHDTLADGLNPTTLLAAAESAHESLNVGNLTSQLPEAGGEFTVFEPMLNLTTYNAPVHNQINWLRWIPPDRSLGYSEM